jgi:hypothetical protein
MRHGARLDELLEVNPVDVLHHEKGLPGLVVVDVENPDHVGVREPGGDVSLVDQVHHGLCRVHLARSHALDGNQAMEPFCASDGGQEHLGLAASPDLAGDLVAVGTRWVEDRW